MSPTREADVLIGALLERLGKTQAQALLARLDQLLARDGEKIHTSEVGFDRGQGLVNQAPYDRRKCDGAETHHQQLKGGVSDAPGRQS